MAHTSISRQAGKTKGTLIASPQMRARVMQTRPKAQGNAVQARPKAREHVVQVRPVLLDTAGKRAPQRDRMARQATIYAHLRAAWPALFASHPPRPFAIGVKREIIARLGLTDEQDLAALRAVLRSAAERRAYLEALAAPGAERHGLDGMPTGPVLEAHRVHAAAALVRTKRPDRAA